MCIQFFTSPLIVTRGQFHQPFGAKRKCTSSHSSAPICSINLHQQNYAQLHQVENMLNLYAVRPMPCASKIFVNLLAQKLHVKCWWIWPQGDKSFTISKLLEKKEFRCKRRWQFKQQIRNKSHQMTQLKDNICFYYTTNKTIRLKW